jgi:hypothetical protein
MAKSVHNDILDAALNYIKTYATRIAVDNAEPTTYTQLITTYMLVLKTISSSDFTGPADGDSSGRKLTSNQHSTVTITNSGTASHIGLGDSGSSKLLFVTTCTNQALTATNTVTIPSWKIEIGDPT